MAIHRRVVLTTSLLLLVACGTTGERVRSPDRLTDTILESFCATLIAEHQSMFSRKITVPQETVSLYEIFALHVLATSGNLGVDDFNADQELNEKLRKTFEPVLIVLPHAPSKCHWKRTDSIRQAQRRNELVLELSSPLRNPYATDPTRELGVFARVTVGVLGGSWYWINLEKKDGIWNVIDIIRLDISEQ